MVKPLKHSKPIITTTSEQTLAGHIRQRLFAGFATATATTTLGLLIVLFAYFRTSQVYGQTLSQTAIIQDLVVHFNSAVLLEILHTRAYLITGNDQSLTSRDLARQDFVDSYTSLQNMAALGRLPTAATEALADVKTLHDEYDALTEEMVTLRRSGQIEATVALFNERSDPLVFSLLTARQNIQSAIRNAALETNRSFSAYTGQIILIASLIFLAGILANGLILARLLATPLATLEYLEQALIETAQSNHLRPLPLPRLVTKPFSPVFQAYNSIITQLNESDVSRLDFLAKIAHNLRSPLASIVGYTELLNAANVSLTSADQANYALAINKQAERLGQMVEQMVMAARVSENRLDLTLTPIRLGGLVAEIVAEAQRRSQRTITLDDQLGSAVITCDVFHLRKAFWNLLDNALRFSAADTPVLVELRRSPAAMGIDISVTDQGFGIAEADLPRLFTRFGRIYNEQTRDVAGNGLGLYITRHIVTRHRGQITVQSQPGQGSTFIISLPLQIGRP